MTPEIQARLQNARYRIAGGEKISLEEMREIIALQRDGRLSAATATTAARTAKAKAAIPHADDLLAELKGDLP